MLVLEELKPVTRASTIFQWYEEVFPLAARHVQRKGGDLEAARDIFQEAVVIYYEKLLNENFETEVSDGAYLMGIVKKLWLKHCEKSLCTERLEYHEVSVEEIKKPLTQKLLLHLKQSGERCLDLLQSFYYEKLTMKQLANRFGYRSERSATVQKYKCLEKVRHEVKQKSLNYEDFLD